MAKDKKAEITEAQFRDARKAAYQVTQALKNITDTCYERGGETHYVADIDPKEAGMRLAKDLLETFRGAAAVKEGQGAWLSTIEGEGWLTGYNINPVLNDERLDSFKEKTQEHLKTSIDIGAGNIPKARKAIDAVVDYLSEAANRSINDAERRSVGKSTREEAQAIAEVASEIAGAVAELKEELLVPVLKASGPLLEENAKKVAEKVDHLKENREERIASKLEESKSKGASNAREVLGLSNAEEVASAAAEASQNKASARG